jgi:hypothetical protein
MDEAKKVVPPPRPKSSKPPPPKPRQSAPPQQPKDSIVPSEELVTANRPLEGNASLLCEILETPDDSAAKLDPYTGFGEWEAVVPVETKCMEPSEGQFEASESTLSSEDKLKESKVSAVLGRKLNSVDLQPELRSKREIDVHLTPLVSGTQFRRIITKKARRKVDSDD